MDIRNLFKGGYWFSQPDQASNEAYLIFVIALFVILAVGFVGLLVRYFKKVEKGTALLLQRVANMTLTMGAVGFVLLFFRQQNVPLFGWRIWFLLWAVLLAVWTYGIVIYYFKKIPEIRKFEEEKTRKEKYLP